MTALAVGLIAVVLLDQAVKRLVRGWLGGASLSLGSLVQIRVVRRRIWLARAWYRLTPAAMWGLWGIAAAALAGISAVAALPGWWAGLLLGGSLSHALETAFRGAVDDYLWLRRWPAFDLADAALLVGAVGLVSAVWQRAWS